MTVPPVSPDRSLRQAREKYAFTNLHECTQQWSPLLPKTSVDTIADGIAMGIASGDRPHGSLYPGKAPAGLIILDSGFTDAENLASMVTVLTK